MPAAQFADHPADLGRAGEADLVDKARGQRPLQAGERLHPLRRDDFEHAGRYPGTAEQLGERLCACGRVDGGLPHDGVAAQQRRDDVPRRNRHRKVARGYHRHHTNRLPEGEQLLVGQLRRHGLAVQTAPLTEKEAAGINDLLYLTARLGQRLADLTGDQPGERGRIVLDEPPEVRDHAPANGRGYIRPARLSRSRGTAGGQQVGGAGKHDLGDHLVQAGGVRRTAHRPARMVLAGCPTGQHDSIAHRCHHHALSR